MTSQDNGEPELWGRCGCIRGTRCCGSRGEEDRDKSKQLDRDFRFYLADKKHCAPRHQRVIDGDIDRASED